MVLHLDNERLRQLVPNVIYEVKGETPLIDKLRPFIETARAWLVKEIIGQTLVVDSNPVYDFAEKIIVYRAFADAIPSLDVSLSPAGFSVINTDGRAPASKERVERLVASLRSFVDSNLPVLLTMLNQLEEWRGSDIGKWWRATFICNIEDVLRFARQGDDLIAHYERCRDIALSFESEMAERFLGRDFLGHLREAYPQAMTDAISDIRAIIRATELKYIGMHINDRRFTCPDDHELWHISRPIIARLKYWPELNEMWADEMKETLTVEPFVNKVHGGFFF